MAAEQSAKHYKAVIAYDGTDFLGFQVQAKGRTVQGIIEQTLQKMAGKPIRITGAGRTDTGVHATGQVIAFQMSWRHSANKLKQALNATLPLDIAISELETTHSNFHPRFDAVSRQYQYTIINQPVRDVMRRRSAAWISRPLNIYLMQRASDHLIGSYDFASYGKPPQGNNSIRTVTQAEWQKHNSQITFEITANAFLYKMVRNIVGALLQVGLEKMPVSEVERILRAKNRALTPAPAAPNGLCLVKVNYNAEDIEGVQK